MKITIEPEDGDKMEKLELSGVQQFALAGVRLDKMIGSIPISHTYINISDIPRLIGQIETCKSQALRLLLNGRSD